MSARELRALKQNSPEFVPARLRSQVRKMSQQKEDSTSKPEGQEVDSIAYERELYLLEGKLVSAEHTIEEQSFRIATLENCISVIKMELELEKYRALETQRRSMKLSCLK